MFKLTVLFAVLGIANGAPALKFPGGRIVGGHDTTIELHPWQLSLQFRHRHFCGAILIAPTWALTAAHCVDDERIDNHAVLAGSTFHSSGGQSIPLSKIILHERGIINMDHDIAILQLAVPVTIATARPARLPAARAPIPNGATLNVTGWGALEENAPGSEILQEVQVPVVTHPQCRSAYGARQITENMFCAGILGQGGKDACQDDSGGPAAIDNVVVGIVSWGIGCAEPTYPGVYIKISNYIDWIREESGI